MLSAQTRLAWYKHIRGGRSDAVLTESTMDLSPLMSDCARTSACLSCGCSKYSQYRHEYGQSYGQYTEQQEIPLLSSYSMSLQDTGLHFLISIYISVSGFFFQKHLKEQNKVEALWCYRVKYLCSYPHSVSIISTISTVSVMSHKCDKC